MNPSYPAPPRPSVSKYILALITAVSVIGAALITARCSSGPDTHRKRRVCLHEMGALSNKTFRIVGPEGFEKTFTGGEVWLPTLSYRTNFEIYTAGKWLGTIKNPTGSDDDVLIIHLAIRSDWWEPAVSSVTMR